MSPTAAMLNRSVLLSTSPAASGASATAARPGTGESSGVAGLSGGPAVQAAMHSSTTPKELRRVSITEADAQNVDAGRPQTASEDVQFVEIVDRSDTYAMIGLVVDRDALNI